MNVKQIKNILIEGGIEANEAEVEAKILIEHFLGLNNIDLALNGEFQTNEELLSAINLRVQKKLPIQHIIKTAYFMGEDFIVNEHVLIPRDETEILVRKAVEIIARKEERGKWKASAVPRSPHPSHLRVLDIGTGSGCIACMIAKLTDAQVLGVDISLEALKIALENTSKLELFNRAIFRKSDIFSNVRKEGLNIEKFDLIVSNPPYIPIKEKANIQKEVTFEPDLALYAQDEEGIEFYEKITAQAPEFLNANGYLLFELGIGQAQKVKSVMKKHGFVDIEIQKDLAEIERVIWGKRDGEG